MQFLHVKFNLKWEETTTYNLGFSFGLYDMSHHLDWSFTKIQRFIAELLATAVVTCFQTGLSKNDLTTKGVEFSLRTFFPMWYELKMLIGI
jgi:hypothetical protein